MNTVRYDSTAKEIMEDTEDPFPFETGGRVGFKWVKKL